MTRPRTAVVITASDRAASGKYADRSGPVAVARLRRWGLDVGDPVVVPDGPAVGEAIGRALLAAPSVILTTGGTGPTARDRTPEQTAPYLDRLLPGVGEAMRTAGVAAGVPTAVLSRGLAGLAGATFVVNLPGSTGGVRDGLDVVGTFLSHLLDELEDGGR